MVNYGIALIGFMGTGKSSVAKILSKKLDLELIEIDDLIERKMKMTIAGIFEKYGEAKFREVEKNIIKKIKDKKNAVISCGGGVCLNNENVVNIKTNNKVILLDASAKVILDRIKMDNHRPILKANMDIESIEKIKITRKPSYHKAADIIIDTDNKTIYEIADEIIRIINAQ